MGARGGGRKLLEVSQARAGDLVEQILERRRKADDPLLARASDDIPALIRYVSATSSRQVSSRVLHDDVLDALELLEFARARIAAVPGVWDHLEYVLLSMRKRALLSLEDIGSRLGVSRQTIHNRLERAAAADAGLVRSEVAHRAEKSSRTAIDRWQRDKALSVRVAMKTIGDHMDELAADQDLIDMVEILVAPDDDRRPPAVTDPVSDADMRLLDRVVRMVRSRPVFATLADSSRVRAAVEQGEWLVGQYRELTAGVEKWRKDLG